MSESKVILVTGASSGFGALTVRALAARGHTVYAGMRALDTRNARAAGGLAAHAAEHQVDLRAVELDVTRQDSAVAAVARPSTSRAAWTSWCTMRGTWCWGRPRRSPPSNW